jgi:hypothetical protein
MRVSSGLVDEIVLSNMINEYGLREIWAKVRV